MSVRGHGLDCHRTWEALALGATVITIHSPLDNLLRPYRVMFIERTTKYWWEVMTDSDWLDHTRRVVARSQKFDIRMNSWISSIFNCFPCSIYIFQIRSRQSSNFTILDIFCDFQRTNKNVMFLNRFAASALHQLHKPPAPSFRFPPPFVSRLMTALS